MQNTIDQLIAWGKELTVLYVEDDVALREEVSLFLSDIFERIDLATNGEEGLVKLTENHYHLVITDIRMPVMDGIEMIEKIKELYPELPILVTSAHNESEYLIKLINLGVNHFITKPIQSDQVLNVLYTIVKHITHEQELDQYKHHLEIANEKLKKFSQMQSKSLDFKNSMLNAYKEALDTVTMVSLSDKNGIILDVNEHFCKATGYSKEEIIGKTHQLLKHPSTSKALYEEMWNTILAKKTWQGILFNQTKNFTPLHQYVTIMPILDKEGEIFEFISIFQDFTELHNLHEQKNKATLNLALNIKEEELLKHIPFPSVIMENNLSFQTYNKLFEEIVNNHVDERLLSKLTSHTLQLKELIDFEEMDLFADIETIKSNWPYDGDITFKGVIKSIGHILQVLVKISDYESNRFLVCIVKEEDFELCCQVQER